MLRLFASLSVRVLSLIVVGGLLTGATSRVVRAQGQPAIDPKDRTITLADGALTLEAPKSWERRAPKSRIIEHEFATPKAEGDALEGRFTVMGAGGGVDANIKRWIGQFSQPDGSATKDKAKQQTLKIAEMEVHFVDISGDFNDQAGPFAPAVLRENYRMLAAIVVTEKLGQHFLKLYGPKATVAAQEKAFQDMLGTLKAK